MAHFARIENGVVTNVIVVSNEALDHDGLFPASETSGQALIASLGLDGEWLQTSYNGNFRGNYAGLGHTYDAGLDAFIPPKPSDDAVLDEETFSWIVPEVDEE
jgi:hypothetical protein